MKKRGLNIIAIGLIYSISVFFFSSVFSYFFRGIDVETAIFNAFWIAFVSFIVMCLFFRSRWIQGQMDESKRIACPIYPNEKYFQLEDETNEN